MNASVAQAVTPDRSEAMDTGRIGPARIETRIASTIHDMWPLEAHWKTLRQTHGMATPNTDPRRFAITVEAFGATVRPYIALFEDHDGPRAIIIGRRSTRSLGCRLYRFTARVPRLRCLDVVYGGLITDGSHEARRAVGDHLETLLRSGEVEHVMINHLPLRHEMFGDLEARNAVTSIDLRGRPSRHWRFALARGSFEETTARFSRKHRYNMRRADRILVEHFDGMVSLRCITRSDQVDAFVDEAARITAAGYQGTIGAGLGRPAVQRQILSAAARDGRLRCYLLECAGTAVAYQAGLICDNVYHLQSTAFEPDYGSLSAGQVLLVRVIRDLSEGGVGTIDYGFGDARYKQIYGTESWDEATIYLYGPTFIGTCARLVHRLTGAATRLAERAGLGDRLKKK